MIRTGTVSPSFQEKTQQGFLLVLGIASTKELEQATCELEGPRLPSESRDTPSLVTWECCETTVPCMEHIADSGLLHLCLGNPCSYFLTPVSETLVSSARLPRVYHSPALCVKGWRVGKTAILAGLQNLYKEIAKQAHE